MYDVLIIGAGAAGLTAAIYTCRKKLKTLILSADIGGQTNLTYNIENYPGVKKITGWDLMKIFEEQAINFGAELIEGKVINIEKNNNSFKIRSSDNRSFETKTLILAHGKTPKSLNIPGEEKFIGKGISNYAVYDAPKFKEKIVAVIGGGNSALESAIFLSKVAKKVYLIHRRNEFKADQISVDKVKSIENIEIILDSTPKEVLGQEKLRSVVIENIGTKETKKIDVDGIFLGIGYQIEPDLIKNLVNLNKMNEIIIDENCNTSCPGIFAAGDLTTVPYKQTVVSAGEGAKAGISVYSYISGKKMVIDWDH